MNTKSVMVGAGAEDGGDLRHHSGGQRIAQEDVRVAREGDHALLDARPARVVEADDGNARLHGEVHDLADLPRVGFGERATEHGEVLGEDEHRPPMHASGAHHHSVAGDALGVHPEVMSLMHHQLVHLRERALVEEELEALAGGFFPGLVLALDALRPPAEVGGLVAAA